MPAANQRHRLSFLTEETLCAPTSSSAPPSLLTLFKSRNFHLLQSASIPSSLQPPSPNKSPFEAHKQRNRPLAAGFSRRSFGRKSPDTSVPLVGLRHAETRRHRSTAADLPRPRPVPVSHRPALPLHRSFFSSCVALTSALAVMPPGPFGRRYESAPGGMASSVWVLMLGD